MVVEYLFTTNDNMVSEELDSFDPPRIHETYTIEDQDYLVVKRFNYYDKKFNLQKVQLHLQPT